MSHRKTPLSLILVCVVAMLAACSREPAPVGEAVSDAATTATGDTIAWFDGSVDEAFAYASENDMPVYLYWGAEWCPPCHAISATVFRSAEFLARSRLFVPVYLDGDTENAQALGEKFGVRGYPTMIVFDSEGTELTRIPGGIDMQAYVNVLDLTLAESTPVGDLVAEIMHQSRALSENECRLLAYYSWNQNPALLEEYEPTALFRRSYDVCPEVLATERSVLYMNYLDEKIDAIDTEIDESKLSTDDIAEALSMVRWVLSDPALISANLFSVIFGAGSIARELTDEGTAERAELNALFIAALDRIAADESVFKRERVYTSLGKIYLEQVDDPEAELSDELRDEIADMVAWADRTTSDPYERQAVINAASNLLARAGMDELARPLLLAELEISKQPYYFMPALANIEENAGNFEAAIGWLKKAYDTSRGPATRFQWGYYYINGLLDLSPEDVALIRSTTVSVIRELEAGSGIYQRPKAQLKRLESRLRVWSEENDRPEDLQGIRTDVLAICGNFAGQQASVESCQAFLDSV